MPSKTPLSNAALAKFEAALDFEALLITSAEQMQGGKTRAVYTPVIEARRNLNLTQEAFADMLGVSARTLQQWEQGRREPSGAARTLVEMARKVPGAFVEAGMVAQAEGARPARTQAARKAPGFRSTRRPGASAAAAPKARA